MDLSKYGPLVGSLLSASSPLLSTGLQMAVGEIPVVGGIIGPFVGMAAPSIVAMIAGQLGMPADASPEAVAATIDADPEAAKTKLSTLEEQHQFDLASQAQQVDLIKTEISMPMAPGVFGFLAYLWTTGWRPLAAWSLGGALMLELVAPWFVWMVQWAGGNPPPLPPTRLDLIVSMLTGLLGLGAMRSFDKTKGTAAGQVKTVAVPVFKRK